MSFESDLLGQMASDTEKIRNELEDLSDSHVAIHTMLVKILEKMDADG